MNSQKGHHMRDVDVIRDGIEDIDAHMNTSAQLVTTALTANGRPQLRLSNYETHAERLRSVLKMLDDMQIITEDDRKGAKRARAAINKSAQEYHRGAKQALDDCIEPFERELRQVDALYRDIGDSLGSKLAEADAAYRDLKRRELNEAFDAIDDVIENVTLDDIFDSHWLGRSVATAAAQQAMRDRLQLVADAMELSDAIDDAGDAIQLLRSRSWRFNDTLRAAAQRKAERVAHAAAVDETQKTPQPTNTDTGTVTFVLTVPAADAAVVEAFVKARSKTWLLERLERADQ